MNRLASVFPELERGLQLQSLAVQRHTAALACQSAMLECGICDHEISIGIQSKLNNDEPDPSLIKRVTEQRTKFDENYFNLSADHDGVSDNVMKHFKSARATNAVELFLTATSSLSYIDSVYEALCAYSEPKKLEMVLFTHLDSIE
jgi:hypothetical protein